MLWLMKQVLFSRATQQAARDNVCLLCNASYVCVCMCMCACVCKLLIHISIILEQFKSLQQQAEQYAAFQQHQGSQQQWGQQRNDQWGQQQNPEQNPWVWGQSGVSVTSHVRCSETNKLMRGCNMQEESWH